MPSRRVIDTNCVKAETGDREREREKGIEVIFALHLFLVRSNVNNYGRCVALKRFTELNVYGVVDCWFMCMSMRVSLCVQINSWHCRFCEIPENAFKRFAYHKSAEMSTHTNARPTSQHAI